MNLYSTLIIKKILLLGFKLVSLFSEVFPKFKLFSFFWIEPEAKDFLLDESE